MPNGEEPEQTNPEEENQDQPGGLGQRARQMGQEKVKQVAKEAVKKAAKQVAKAAVQAAASFFMAYWPYILGAIFIIGLGVVIFLIATGALQGGFGGTPLQAATLSNQSHVLELKELVNNLRLDLTSSSEKYQEDVKKLQQKIKEIEPILSGQSSEVLKKYQELKDKAASLDNYTDPAAQKKEIEELLGQIDKLIADISDLMAKQSGGLVDFSDVGVRLGAIGPGSRHSIEGRAYEVFRAPNLEMAEKIAREAAAMVGLQTINGRKRKETSKQCYYLISVSLERAGVNRSQLNKITGSPPRQRGDLVHFLKGNSPYDTGNQHWAIQI